MDNDRTSFCALVGARIHVARKARRLTQVHIAAALGVTRQQIARIEDGHTELGIYELHRVARYLNTDVASLLGVTLPAPAPMPCGTCDAKDRTIASLNDRIERAGEHARACEAAAQRVAYAVKGGGAR